MNNVQTPLDSWHTRKIGESLLDTLGGRLRHAREFRNLTQREAAPKLNIGQRQLLRYENDQSTPSIAKLQQVAAAYEVSYLWLLQGTGRMLDIEDTGQSLLSTPDLDVKVVGKRLVVCPRATGRIVTFFVNDELNIQLMD